MKNMKTFYQFNEELKRIGDDNTGSSKAYTASKYDVLKKSKNDIYHEWEFQVHEMMKKRPDLFCRILKNSKEQVLTEKLDTRQFLKFYENSLKNLSGDIKEKFDEPFNYDSEWRKRFQHFLESNDFKNLTILQQNFINLKLNIYEYFEDFMEYTLNKWERDHDYIDVRLPYCDLFGKNFGFIKGTQEIRCFDPVFVGFTKDIEYED